MIKRKNCLRILIVVFLALSFFSNTTGEIVVFHDNHIIQSLLNPDFITDFEKMITDDKIVSYEPHFPIRIVGNDGFTVNNGVVSGNGSIDNPYIIEGWDIECTNFWEVLNRLLGLLEDRPCRGDIIYENIPVCGILLKDTSDHVLIRNNHIHHWDGVNRELLQIAGITMINSSNVTIEHNVFEYNKRGVNIQNRQKIKKIVGSTVQFTIRSYRTGSIRILNNSFTENSPDALHLSSVVDSLIDSNCFSYNDCGIRLINTKVNISRNEIFLNGNGIMCSTLDRSFISYNNISSNGNGVYVTYSTAGYETSPLIENNTLRGNGAGILISGNKPFIANNTIQANYYGITNMDLNRLPISILDNIIENNTWFGICLTGTYIIKHNVISHNEDGLSIRGNMTVSSNIVSGNDVAGIVCDETCIFRFNNICDNGVYGLRSKPSVTDQIDAQLNYWGSPDGPGGLGPGSGDEINEYVIFDPWLMEPNTSAGPRK